MKKLSSLPSATCLLFACLVTTPVGAEDWTRFRGPNGTGVTDGVSLPVDFGPDKGVVWSSEVPFGRSSPAFGADRIYLSAVEDDTLVTQALDRASGELLWSRSIGKVRSGDLYHGTDSASASPVTDGRNVYVFFHEAGLVSYDPEGNLRWQRDLGAFRNFYGIAASPIIHRETLYLVADQVEGSFVAAFETATGEEIWRAPRARVESYATPIFYPDATAPKALIVLGSTWIDAYDLATGESLWSMRGVGVSPVSSPTLSGDLLVVSAPDHQPEPMPPFGGLLAERDANGDGALDRSEVEGFWMENHFGFADVDDSGAITAADYEYLEREMASDAWGIFGVRLEADGGASLLWNVRQSVPYVPSPLVYDGVVYVVKDSILTTLEPATGDVLKRGRLGKGKSGVNASPVAGDGKVFVATSDGVVAVLAAQAEWEVLAMNDMGAPIHATPVIADDSLYVRTDNRLFRLGATEPSTTD